MNSIASTMTRPPRSLATVSARSILFLLRARAILVLIVLLVMFSAMAPAFLTINNFSILAKHVSITALLAVGTTFVILTGGIDLSVGSVAGLGGMVAGYLLTQGFHYGGTVHYAPAFIAILASVAACLAVGLLNGWLIARAGVAPFIATLGTLYIARGAALLTSNGKTFPDLAGIPGRGNTGFTLIGQSAPSACRLRFGSCWPSLPPHG